MRSIEDSFEVRALNCGDPGFGYDISLRHTPDSASIGVPAASASRGNVRSSEQRRRTDDLRSPPWTDHGIPIPRLEGDLPNHPYEPHVTHNLSQKALANLRAFAPPPTNWYRCPLNRRAAVLILLFADRRGDLRVVLTIRSSGLKNYAGQAALPGGKSDTMQETPWLTARREAFEERLLIRASSVRLIRRHELREVRKNTNRAFSNLFRNAGDTPFSCRVHGPRSLTPRSPSRVGPSILGATAFFFGRCLVAESRVR